jgi:hypothetical protein
VAQLPAAAVRQSKFRSVRQGAYLPLGLVTEEGHRVRPGQVLELQQLNGQALSILNVHLKAGCNQHDLQDPWAESQSGNPDRPVQSCDPWAEPSLTTQRQARKVACNALRRQLQFLEAWIDGQAQAEGLPRRSSRFIVAGDFNRRLAGELSPKRGPARKDDSSPSKPYDDALVRLVWPEINDGDPPEARMRLALPALEERRERGRPECKHQGIDHFAVSVALAGPRGERMQPLQTRSLPALQSGLGLSDHCPISISLTQP